MPATPFTDRFPWLLTGLFLIAPVLELLEGLSE